MLGRRQAARKKHHHWKEEGDRLAKTVGRDTLQRKSRHPNRCQRHTHPGRRARLARGGRQEYCDCGRRSAGSIDGHHSERQGQN